MTERRVVIGECPACRASVWFSMIWRFSEKNEQECWSCQSADLELTPVLLDPSGRGSPLVKSREGVEE